MSAAAKRVVVTGCGGISALGQDWPTIERALRDGVSGVVRIDEWDRYTELNTRLGGRVPPLQHLARVLRREVEGRGARGGNGEGRSRGQR